MSVVVKLGQGVGMWYNGGMKTTHYDRIKAKGRKDAKMAAERDWEFSFYGGGILTPLRSGCAENPARCSYSLPATLATNWATSRAWVPWRIAAGMLP